MARHRVLPGLIAIIALLVAATPAPASSGGEMQTHADIAYAPDRLVFTSLLSNPTCIDGGSLLSTTHSFGNAGGTWSNKVTTALSFSTVNTGIAAMKSLLDEQGEYFDLVPKILLVGTANERTALEIAGIGADTRPVGIKTDGTLDATSNIQSGTSIGNVYKGRLTVIVSPRFEDGTNTASWFLIDPRYPAMGWLNGGGTPNDGEMSGKGPSVTTTIIDQPNQDIPANEDNFAYGVQFDGRAFGLAPYGIYGRVG